MTKKTYAILGIYTPVFFWCLYFIMANARPEYSFLYKAVSELGSLDAPHKWTWNILGYILPGIVLAIYSYGLYKNISTPHGSKLPLIGFVGSFLLLSLSGIFPADMDNRSSTTTVLHLAGAFGSYFFFLIGAFTYPKQMKKSVYWKKAVKPTLLFTFITILFGNWYFVFPHMPAVGQRFVFFFYLLWIFYTAVLLYKQPDKDENLRSITLVMSSDNDVDDTKDES